MSIFSTHYLGNTFTPQKTEVKPKEIGSNKKQISTISRNQATAEQSTPKNLPLYTAPAVYFGITPQKASPENSIEKTKEAEETKHLKQLPESLQQIFEITEKLTSWSSKPKVEVDYVSYVILQLISEEFALRDKPEARKELLDKQTEQTISDLRRTLLADKSTPALNKEEQRVIFAHALSSVTAGEEKFPFVSFMKTKLNPSKKQFFILETLKNPPKILTPKEPEMSDSLIELIKKTTLKPESNNLPFFLNNYTDSSGDATKALELIVEHDDLRRYLNARICTLAQDNSTLFSKWIPIMKNTVKMLNQEEADLKHLSLAMVYWAKEATKTTAESPEDIIHSPLHSLTDEKDRQRRSALDAIIPPEYRKDMTETQVHSLLSEAEKELENLVYSEGEQALRDKLIGEISIAPNLSKILTNAWQNKGKQEGHLPFIAVDLIRSFSANESASEENKMVSAIMANIVSKAKNSSTNIPKISFDDIGGYENEKAQIHDFLDPLIDYQMAKDIYGGEDEAPPPKGLLLKGPPGTGKTQFAKAIANKLKLPFFEYNGADFSRMFVGTGADNVDKMFELAEKHEQAVIFIDEIDALTGKRSDTNNNPERDAALNTFLGKLDGFAERPGIIIIGATNRTDMMDPAVLRPGRFDEQIEVGLPNTEGRKEILKIHTRKIDLAPNVKLNKLAQLTRTQSGAELAHLVKKARLEAFRRNDSKAGFTVTMKDFDEAFDNIAMGLKSNQKFDDFGRELVAHHEVMGHGLIAYLAGLELRTLSTIARGDSAGHVYYLPEEGFKSNTLDHFLKEVIIDLAGRGAEEVINGKRLITDGARGDYKNVRGMLTSLISSGLIPGHDSRIYQTGELSKEDQLFVGYLLRRGLQTAEKIIESVSNRDDIMAKMLTPKGVEIRGAKANKFYENNLKADEVETMKGILDDFVGEVVDLLEDKAESVAVDYEKHATVKEKVNAVPSPATTKFQGVFLR